SNARRYRLRLDGGASFVQIGSDLGLLDRPVKHDYIDLSPAERSDVVVDFSGVRPGTRIVLRNDFGNGSTAQVMAFVVGRKVADDSRIPNRLVPIEKLDPTKAVRRRTWHFTRGRFKGHEGWTINNRPFDPDRMDARPRLGELEVWRFYSDLHHPVHIHLAPFQIVSRGGHPPGEFDRGWKDTVDVRPAEYVDVAVRFTGYTGRYMLHCHNLEHEDMAMMSAFETVAQAGSVADPRTCGIVRAVGHLCRGSSTARESPMPWFPRTRGQRGWVGSAGMSTVRSHAHTAIAHHGRTPGSPGRVRSGVGRGDR